MSIFDLRAIKCVGSHDAKMKSTSNRLIKHELRGTSNIECKQVFFGRISINFLLRRF